MADTGSQSLNSEGDTRDTEAATANPADDIYDFPRTIPTTDLFNPTMVTINIIEEGAKGTLVVPRALICAKSAYFRKAFEGGLAEASSRAITLEDDDIASRRALEIFVSWLYTGRIYREAAEKSEDRRTIVEEQPGLDDAQIGESSIDAIGQVSEKKPSPESAQPDTTAKRIMAKSDTFHPCCSLATSDVCENGCGSIKLDRPHLWPFHHLFELYVFADKYDTRDLRNQIMQLVQLKMLYSDDSPSYPGYSAIGFVSERLPRTSLLYQFVVDILAFKIRLGNETGTAFRTFNKFPKEFVVDCLISAQQFMTAYESEDEPNKDICDFHEHGEDAEEYARCQRRWTHFEEKYGPKGAIDS